MCSFSKFYQNLSSINQTFLESLLFKKIYIGYSVGDTIPKEYILNNQRGFVSFTGPVRVKPQIPFYRLAKAEAMGNFFRLKLKYMKDLASRFGQRRY